MLLLGRRRVPALAGRRGRKSAAEECTRELRLWRDLYIRGTRKCRADAEANARPHERADRAAKYANTYIGFDNTRSHGPANNGHPNKEPLGAIAEPDFPSDIAVTCCRDERQCEHYG